MSRNNTNKAQAGTTQPSAEAPKKPKFIFDHYQENAANEDPSRIDAFITDEFSFDEWAPAWIRYDSLEKAVKSRYFQIVEKSTHGHLFKEHAFDPMTGQIGRGKEYLHPSLGGIHELVLCIREREADNEEQRQMAEASARRLEQNEKVKELKEKMGGVVGTNVFGGVSMSHSPSGWLSK